MKSMAIGDFKAHAVRVVAEVAQIKEGILLTKGGEPVAEVLPFRGGENAPKPGKLASTLVFERDIVSPAADNDWSACR